MFSPPVKTSSKAMVSGVTILAKGAIMLPSKAGSKGGRRVVRISKKNITTTTTSQVEDEGKFLFVYNHRSSIL